eukprot:TRINITY_DN3026_c0_g1_i2.p1 TRINITY_DN3026_c0_g1~~TRINITY_DN3026_c0_g1_i2.p1  ORF type:complete len:771 (+),score=146.03 TRINITY_DN3026_c0_g1_i2:31-2313(+)
MEDDNSILLECDPLYPKKLLSADIAALTTRIPGKQKLSLRGHVMGRDCQENLRQLVQGKELRYIDLSYCRIGSEAAVAIAEAIGERRAQRSNVSTLKLSFCHIGVTAMPRIARSLESVSCRLRSLSLSYNPITAQGLGLLLKWAIGITHIDCKYCGILSHSSGREAGLSFILEGLHENTACSLLELQGNNFTKDDQQRVFEEVACNRRSALRPGSIIFADPKVEDVFFCSENLRRYLKWGDAHNVELALSSGLTPDGVVRSWSAADYVYNPSQESPLVTEILKLEAASTVPYHPRIAPAAYQWQEVLNAVGRDTTSTPLAAWVPGPKHESTLQSNGLHSTLAVVGNDLVRRPSPQRSHRAASPSAPSDVYIISDNDVGATTNTSNWERVSMSSSPLRTRSLPRKASPRRASPRRGRASPQRASPMRRASPTRRISPMRSTKNTAARRISPLRRPRSVSSTRTRGSRIPQPRGYDDITPPEVPIDDQLVVPPSLRSSPARTRTGSISILSDVLTQRPVTRADRVTPALLNACMSGDTVCREIIGDHLFGALPAEGGKLQGVPSQLVPCCGLPNVLNHLRLGSDERVTGIAKLLFILLSAPCRITADEEFEVISQASALVARSADPTYESIRRRDDYEMKRREENRRARTLLRALRGLDDNVRQKERRNTGRGRGEKKRSQSMTSFPAASSHGGQEWLHQVVLKRPPQPLSIRSGRSTTQSYHPSSRSRSLAADPVPPPYLPVPRNTPSRRSKSQPHRREYV